MANNLSLVIKSPENGEFLKRICWNKEAFIELIGGIAKQYEGASYTEDQMKLAKEDRAKLNAIKKVISDRRIEIKKLVMEPYEKFEAEVKEVVALIDAPAAMIDRQIKEQEERAKEEKREALKEHFQERIGSLKDMVTLQQIFDPKWLNLSVSLKKAKEDMESKIYEIESNLETIEGMCEEKYLVAVKAQYIKTLDINEAFAEMKRLKEMEKIEEEKRRKKEEAMLAAEKAREEAEKEKAAEEARKAANAPDEEEAGDPEDESGPERCEEKAEPEEAPKPAEEEEKRYKATFTVTGTKKQLIELKRYMEMAGLTVQSGNGGK